jgi:beta-phosphoglucomutase-like phosphatase (HAD superfamily)
VKKYILFDHDGVLVDTEFWYYKAGERALADIGLTLDKDQYLRDMNQGLGTWVQARAAGVEIIREKRQVRKFMDFVLVREDYKLAKPHPEPYLTGLKRFGATKKEALVVEDSSRGLNAAVAAGIDCVIVHNDFTKAGDFSRASYRIEKLIELNDIILNVT